MSEDAAPKFEEVMRLARKWHYDEVRSIVQCAIDELREELKSNPLESRERREWLTEWVDEATGSHEHVIYNGQAAMLLAASDNEDAWEGEWAGKERPTLQNRAYYALCADVWERLDARSDEWEQDNASV